MLHARQLLYVVWFLCLAMVLWTTDVHAQIIPPGGGNGVCDSDETSLEPTTQEKCSSSASFQLEPGYPNPFNPSTQIRYVLQKPAPVQLDVYNLLGQRVQTLAEGWHEAGTYDVQWNARNAQGAELAGGVYLIRLTVQNAVQTQTVVFQK